MSVCSSLRAYCLENHWAANFFAFLGTAQFLGTIWVTIEYQRPVLAWLTENILVHSPIFGLACIVNVVTMSTFVCLGFADCGKEGTDCPNAHRGRYTGSTIVPGAWDWLSHLGGKQSRR